MLMGRMEVFFFFLVPSGARSSPPLVDGVVRLGLEMATRSRSPLCAALLLSTKSAGGGGSLASRACVMVLLGRKVFVRCGSDGTEGMGLGWRWAKKGKKRLEANRCWGRWEGTLLSSLSSWAVRSLSSLVVRAFSGFGCVELRVSCAGSAFPSRRKAALQCWKFRAGE
jgi:hypothetical protein